MRKTKIEWCDATVNPVVGCKNNCEYCYARKLNDRFHFVEDFSKPQFFSERLKQLHSQTPQVIFMNSMSDIADWELKWVKRTYMNILASPQHKYIFLTKNMRKFLTSLAEEPNALTAICVDKANAIVWFGITITLQSDFDKLIDSADILNIEPILEPIQLKRIANYRWLIIGAETGNRKGKIIPKKEWVDGICEQCDRYKIPVFMKESLLPIMGEENMRRKFPKELQKGVGY